MVRTSDCTVPGIRGAGGRNRLTSRKKGLTKLYIDSTRALRDFCKTLRAAGEFGFDTEFIRERSYIPQLCFVQAATPDTIALIDPFCVEMDAFWQLVAAPDVVKIVHAGEQDLEMGYIQTQKAPANVVDVQIAAGLAGLDYPMSYGNLVQEVVGAEVEQGKAFSEWSQRPLSDAQLRYAAADVAYLCPAWDDLNERLGRLGRQEWLREEMAPFERKEAYVCEPELLYQRVRGWEQLSPRTLGVLRELAAWREQAAGKADLPPRTFLTDPALRAVARDVPETVPELARVKGFPRPLARSAGRTILKLIDKGRNVPRGDLPRPGVSRRSDSARRKGVDEVMAAGQAYCAENQLNHGLFASRAGYAALVRYIGRDRGNGSPPRLLTGWRKEFAGDRLAKLLT